MASNKNLHGAKREKNDEFYTQLSDIEKELVHYKDHFKDKVVLCNCNDALHSNFAKYFSLNFEFLGLKKLICTSYGDGDENGKVCIYTGDKNGNRIPDIEEWYCYELDGKGDFRSDACIELLKESDIVVTNPPFSLFREFVATLEKYNKKYLIIGNMNAVTYKEVFPLIKDNKAWLGVSRNGCGSMWFIIPENSNNHSGQKIENDVKYQTIGSSMWFTNLEHTKRHEKIDLYKHYNPEEYPKYDNYDAIEVSKVCEIPMNYDGVIGVPITFLGKYCPEQFEIIGLMSGVKHDVFINGDDGRAKFYINGKGVYARILIRIKK